ncbi:hypothetical protein PX699_13470 [Sphingobium sp. H39-3-25]|uniref:hypothetical protein n=1 Tax=Sphingobium arseniciresistens TaxID=3030834 RepID=UPI0023B9F0FE|nr:hypothetical protein [Sphingobium arseniciresistens]
MNTQTPDRRVPPCDSCGAGNNGHPALQSVNASLRAGSDDIMLAKVGNAATDIPAGDKFGREDTDAHGIIAIALTQGGRVKPMLAQFIPVTDGAPPRGRSPSLAFGVAANHHGEDQ